MMRSESTSALGQPKLTKPILGEPILGEPIFGGLMARGVAAFWLLWSLAFVLMLWAVSARVHLQDALAAELLQGHLANASAGATC